MPCRFRRVEGRVEDSDGEPLRVEHACELQHRADVPLERQGEQRDAHGTTPVLGCSGHSCRSAARLLLARMMAVFSRYILYYIHLLVDQ